MGGVLVVSMMEQEVELRLFRDIWQTSMKVDWFVMNWQQPSKDRG